MAADQEINDDAKFVETCVELQLLNETDAALLQKIVRRSGSIAQEALKQGLLTASDIDIVHSLQHPTLAVPGYEILGVIGRGGMGVVYKARQLDLDRTVALKTILIDNVSDETIAARFQREAKALARLQHPNIVQALNFGQHRGRYFFAMEFVDGRTCEDAISHDGLMPPGNVWFLVRQVASGLLHALNQNLIHRDIKPANLMLVRPPEGSPWSDSVEIVKITDFGLAMFAETSDDKLRLTTGDKIMGSPAYMSPEQFGLGAVDFRTDIYALGVTAWHLLFGSPPFQGKSVVELYHQKVKPLVIDRQSLPATIPDNQWQLLMGMLDPQADQRPASYELLIDAIDGMGVSNPMAHGTSGAPGAGPTLGRSNSDHQETLELPATGTDADLQSSDPDAETVSSSDALQPTVQLHSPARQSARLIRKVVVAIAIAVTCVSVWAILSESPPKRGERNFTRVAGNVPLYDGITLSGWDVGGTTVGQWSTAEAPDKSTAIICSSRRGALTRRIPDLPHPRISLFAWLTDKDSVIEIDFAIDLSESEDVRASLRVSDAGLQLGLKDSDFGDLDTIAQKDRPATLYNRYHVIDIERQQDDWFIFFEQKLVGTVPIKSCGTGDALRLVVHEAGKSQSDAVSAYFADLQIVELE